jgi:hypothetical protein
LGKVPEWFPNGSKRVAEPQKEVEVEDEVEVEVEIPATQGGKPAEEEMTDERKAVFRKGVALLKSQGCKEDSARSFLAGLIRDHTLLRAASAVKKAVDAQPAEAKSFMLGCLKPISEKRVTKGKTNRERIDEEQAAIANGL